MARAGPNQNQKSDPELDHSICYVGGRQPSMWALFCCFSKHISRKLDQKQNKQTSAHTAGHRWWLNPPYSYTTASALST